MDVAVRESGELLHARTHPDPGELPVARGRVHRVAPVQLNAAAAACFLYA